MNKRDIKQVIFMFVECIEKFNNYLTAEYELYDIPYNSGKLFPKKGKVTIEGHFVEYNFHGRGCSIIWDELLIKYDIDAVSKHQIIISTYPIFLFINSLPNIQESEKYSIEEVDIALKDLEQQGVLMTRKLTDLGSFHVNKIWVDAYKYGKEFTGQNKDEIDWI